MISNKSGPRPAGRFSTWQRTETRKITPLHLLATRTAAPGARYVRRVSAVPSNVAIGAKRTSQNKANVANDPTETCIAWHCCGANRASLPFRSSQIAGLMPRGKGRLWRMSYSRGVKWATRPCKLSISIIDIQFRVTSSLPSYAQAAGILRVCVPMSCLLMTRIIMAA